MTPAERAKIEQEQIAHLENFEWENRYMKSPLHVIQPADPGTFVLHDCWPEAPIRDRVIAWDISTEEDGWCLPITTAGVEPTTGRFVLQPDGSINALGAYGESWESMEDFIRFGMREWAEKKEVKS